MQCVLQLDLMCVCVCVCRALRVCNIQSILSKGEPVFLSRAGHQLTWQDRACTPDAAGSSVAPDVSHKAWTLPLYINDV